MNRPCLALSVLSICLGCLPIAAEFAYSAPQPGARRSQRIFFKVCCVPSSNQCIHHEDGDDTEFANDFEPAAEHDVPVANPITMDELNDDRYFYDDYDYDCYGYGNDDGYRYEDDPSDVRQHDAVTIEEEDEDLDFRSEHDPEYDLEVYGDHEIEQLEDTAINEESTNEEAISVDDDATSDYVDDNDYDYEEYWHEYEVVDSEATEVVEDDAVEGNIADEVEEDVVETSEPAYDYEYEGDYGDDYEDYYGEEYDEYWGDSEPSPAENSPAKDDVIEDEPVVTEEVEENDWYDDEEYEAYDYEDYEPYGYEEYEYEVDEYDVEEYNVEESDADEVVEEQASDDEEYWYDWEDDADLSDVESDESDALSIEEMERGRSVLLLIANTLEQMSESLGSASRKLASFANSNDLSASTQSGGDLR